MGGGREGTGTRFSRARRKGVAQRWSYGDVTGRDIDHTLPKNRGVSFFFLLFVNTKSSYYTVSSLTISRVLIVRRQWVRSDHGVQAV